MNYNNLNNFDENQLTDCNYMFYKLPSDVTICIKDINDESKILSKLENGKKCYAIDYIDCLYSKLNKLNNIDKDCNEICDKSLQFQYKYNDRCYPNFLKEFLYYNKPYQKVECKCKLDEYLLCPNVAVNKGFYTKCNVNYYPRENNTLKVGEYIKYYNNPEGYYLDFNLYKKCFYTCKSCNILGNKMTSPPS